MRSVWQSVSSYLNINKVTRTDRIKCRLGHGYAKPAKAHRQYKEQFSHDDAPWVLLGW
jgi:hypothetical protein